MTNTELSLGGALTTKRLGFGAMRLPAGTFTGPARDPESGKAVLRRAGELGVNHVDTAGFYRRGDLAANDPSRAALHPAAPDLGIAAKVGPIPCERGRPE